MLIFPKQYHPATPGSGRKHKVDYMCGMCLAYTNHTLSMALALAYFLLHLLLLNVVS